MKLSVHAWRTMWAYHAWIGVAAGLVLHVMFVAGIATLFLVPMKVWEEPAQHVAARAQSPQALLERGIAAIGQAPRRLWLGVPEGEAGVPRFQYARGRVWSAGWLTDDGFVPEREGVATMLYHLHYLWHPALPELEYLAGLLGIAFLLAVITGVVIHWKDLRRQWGQLRPDLGQKTWWSDLHKVLGLFGLPFQVVWVYTGVLVALGPVLITALSGPVFAKDSDAARIAWNEPVLPDVLPPVRAVPITLDEAQRIAERELPGFTPIAFAVLGHGTPKAAIRAFGEIAGPGPDRYATVTLHAPTGAVLHVDAAATDLPSHRVRRWLGGIHYGYFGGLGMRVALALLALAGCVTILSGNCLRLARRKAEDRHVLARLTAGAGAGIFVAIGAVLVASRALPMGLAGRQLVEQAVLAGALVGCVAWALRARAPGAVWVQQLALAGGLFASVPLWAARLSPAGLLGGGPSVAAVRGVEVGFVVVGAALLATAWLLRRRFAVRVPPAIVWAIGAAGAIAAWPRGDGLLLGVMCELFWLALIGTLAVLLSGGTRRSPRAP